jgi:hypothetical protein
MAHGMTRLPVIPLLLLAACASNPAPSPDEARAVERGVLDLLARIATDLAREGPTGWLPHFLPGASFFMASYGVLAFQNGEEATAICLEMTKRFGSMELIWSDVRVRVLGPDAAAFGAGYREDMQQLAGGKVHFEGYVTGTAVRTAERWQLQHLHWSRRGPLTQEP